MSHGFPAQWQDCAGGLKAKAAGRVRPAGGFFYATWQVLTGLAPIGWDLWSGAG